MKTKLFYFGALCAGLMLSATVITSCSKEDVGKPVTPFKQPELRLKATSKITWNLSCGYATVGNGTFKIVNRNSGKLLDVSGGSTANGGNVIQWAENGGNNQKWTLTVNSSGYYTLMNVNSGKMLDAANCGTANGTSVDQWANLGNNCQQWQFVDVGSGYYRIINRNSGKDLDVSSASMADGGNVLLWSSNGGYNQQWQLRVIPTADQQDAYNRITAAMNAAVARYNNWGDWGRVLTVYYDTGVPTAQSNIYGQIWFGAGRTYMTECTAMHEMSHCFGVGTASGWSSPLIQNNIFVGANAVAKIHEFDGASAVINIAGIHFWPYGLNYNSEWSTTAGDRNAQIVKAMNADGL